jgi:hypothetical protein
MSKEFKGGPRVRAFGKTRQSWRKLEGTQIERIVKTDLLKVLPLGFECHVNPNEGIDLYLTDGTILNVEVKSAKAKTYEKRGTKFTARTGRFTIKKDDYLHSDFFAFVVKQIDPETLVWTKQYKIYYVRTIDIQEYIKKRNLYGHKQVKLSVNTIKRLSKLNVELLSLLIPQKSILEKLKEEEKRWKE